MGMNQRQAPEPGFNSRQALSILRRLMKYMSGWQLHFYGMIMLMLLLLGFEMIMPLLVESAVNAISISEVLHVDFSSLTFSIILIVIAAIFNACAGGAAEKLAAKITLNISLRLRQDAVNALLNTGVSSFDKLRRGDIISRLENDAEIAAGAFSEAFRELFSCLIMVVGCSVIMLIKCKSLAVLCIGFSILSVFLIMSFSKMLIPAFSQQQRTLGLLSHHTEESVKTFRSCLTGRRGAENLRRMEQLNKDYFTKKLHTARLELLMGPLMLLLGNLNLLIAFFFGVRQVISGAITLGVMQAFVMYSKQLMEPLSTIGEQFSQVQNAVASAERVFEMIDMQPEPSAIALNTGAEGSFPRAPELRFENVSFAYHKNHPVLKDISLTVHPGETLALTGKTGTGKTTLANLSLFYTDYSGSITVDGTDIRTIGLEKLRSMITYISQEPLITDGTVYENMVYGCGEVSRQQVEETVSLLQMGDMLRSLGSGLDTRLHSADTHLSQGQLQLICMARAVLRDSRIVILDEASSSVDPKTEQLVRQGMASAMAGRTCIVIAHRLSSVQDADHTALLQDGIIAEYGTHQELMAEKGAYYALVHEQKLGKEI